MDLPEIVAGSYEELLLGYKIVEGNEGQGYSLEQSFTDRSHTGCVKTVDISKKGILASGSTDETVRLFNLRKRVELGTLMEHEGAVTCLQFHGRSHLFTASHDKTLCIWKSFTWERLRTLKGHRGAVNSLSVHPSGKLALSVGQDKSLHTWNLVKGRSAYITNTKQAVDLVVWSLSGDRYVLVINNTIDIYNTETATVHCSIKASGRVNALVFIENSVIAYGGEGGDIVLHNIAEDKQLACVKTNTVRIRGLACTNCPNNDQRTWLVSASSDGIIKVWEISIEEDKAEVELITEHNTKFRLTCVAVTRSRKNNYEGLLKSSDAPKKSDDPATVKTEDTSEIQERLQPTEGNAGLGSDVNSESEDSDMQKTTKSWKAQRIEQSEKKTKKKRKRQIPIQEGSPEKTPDIKKMKKRKKTI